MKGKKIDIDTYKYRVAYGIGQNYYHLSNEIESLNIDYLMDQKWEQDDSIVEIDGKRIIRFSELVNLSNVLVIIIPNSYAIRKQISQQFSGYDNITLIAISELLESITIVESKELRALLPENQCIDKRGNAIYFNESISGVFTIMFYGRNNIVRIGRNSVMTNAQFICGNNGSIEIGDKTTIEGAAFHSSEARVVIGQDCMISMDVIVRNHDNHHIFDMRTNERINYNKDVVIGNHVWIGKDATLLSGCRIGDGSIVAENATTSSSFPSNVIVAGCPAKIIRESVCWSRDNTFFFNRNSLDECVDQNAKKYF